jgi:Bacterial Ig-like domain (group 2)
MKRLIISVLVTTLALAACDLLDQSSPSEPTIPSSGGVSRVAVTPESTVVSIGKTVRLNVSVQAENGNPMSGKLVDWFTYDAAIATVDNAGNVTGVSTGNATITASVDGKRGSSRVRVAAAPTTPTTPSGLTITAIGPVPLVEGGQAIIQGNGFGNVPSNLWVYVDGVVGKVSATNGTALQFTVPVTGKPARTVEVKVRLLTAYSNVVQVPIKP